MVFDRNELVFFENAMYFNDSVIDANARTCRFLQKLNVFLRLWLRVAFAEKYKVFVTLCTTFFKNTMLSLCFSVARLKLGTQMLTFT